MKTIEEAAKEYADKPGMSNERMFRSTTIADFKAGIEFAQRWISVEDDTPIFEGESYQVLVRGHRAHPEKVTCWTVGIAEDESIIRSVFTHWRPIELK